MFKVSKRRGIQTLMRGKRAQTNNAKNGKIFHISVMISSAITQKMSAYSPNESPVRPYCSDACEGAGELWPKTRGKNRWANRNRARQCEFHFEHTSLSQKFCLYHFFSLFHLCLSCCPTNRFKKHLLLQLQACSHPGTIWSETTTQRSSQEWSSMRSSIHLSPFNRLSSSWASQSQFTIAWMIRSRNPFSNLALSRFCFPRMTCSFGTMHTSSMFARLLSKVVVWRIVKLKSLKFLPLIPALLCLPFKAKNRRQLWLKQRTFKSAFCSKFDWSSSLTLKRLILVCDIFFLFHILQPIFTCVLFM